MSKCGCGRKRGKDGKVIFNYNGYKLKIIKIGLKCRTCTIKEFLGGFDSFKGRMIKDEKGIIVDWDYYSHVNEDVRPRLNEILIALGVLAYKSNGNWNIVGSGMSLNPSNLGETLFFTRRKDVLEFARINYGRALYHCEARKISAIIKQEKFSRPV